MDDLSTTADPIDAASATYLGRWHRLVSTTNWEKGRIIHEWRQALIDSRRPRRPNTPMMPGAAESAASAASTSAACAASTSALARVHQRLRGSVLESLPGRDRLERRRNVARRCDAKPLVGGRHAPRAVAGVWRCGGFGTSRIRSRAGRARRGRGRGGMAATQSLVEQR